jgi:hypothetical protein
VASLAAAAFFEQNQEFKIKGKYSGVRRNIYLNMEYN